jgi:hypothetical protein
LYGKVVGSKRVKAHYFWQMKDPSENPFLVYLKIGLKYEYLRYN